MHRAMMCDIVFALYDVIPDDSNIMSSLFAAFLAVYIILRQLTFTDKDLDLLQTNMEVLHRHVNALRLFSCARYS
jgi:hypothetical protein